MARITEALLGNKAFGSGQNHPLLDLRFGGQNGYIPNLKQWVSNQAYIRRNLITIVLKAPSFFEKMPDPGIWRATLKALFEVHPQIVEGLQAGIKMDVEEHQVGASGADFFHEFTGSKRDKSELSLTYASDKYGMPIQTFYDNWQRWGMADPDTQFALVGTLDDYPPDMLADQYSAETLHFEPDPTHRRVLKAWVGCNIWPKENGEVIGKRDLTSASSLEKLTIPFTGLFQTGPGPVAFAQQVLNALNITNANPYLRQSFISEVSSDIEALKETGYGSNLDYTKDAQLPKRQAV